MADIRSWLKNRVPTQRRIIQLYTALLYNAHIKGFITGEIYTGELKNVCLPGLNCYSCPGAIGACPLGALQNAIGSSGKRLPFYIIGIIMLAGLTLGRTVCGFLCPFGLLQELIAKVPVPKLRKSRLTRALSYLKYIVLAVFVIAVPLYSSVKSLPLPAFCKYICPAGTLEGAVALLANPENSGMFSMLGALFTNKLVILVLILTGCMFIHRMFCRFLCPLGAIYGCFNRIALAGIKTDSTECVSCGLCVSKCEMDVRRVGDHECVQCGRCISACPAKAISWKGGKIFLLPNEVYNKPEHRKKRRFRAAAAWALALILLAGTVIYTNLPARNETIAYSGPDISVPLYGADGGEFRPADCAGGVTVINFWATWCAPCCKELPYFQQLKDTYPQVNVVAVHSNLVTEDVQKFLDSQPYTFPFALDTDGSLIAYFGGSMLLPMTVVLDKNGETVYSAAGSVTYEKLESLVLPII